MLTSVCCFMPSITTRTASTAAAADAVGSKPASAACREGAQGSHERCLPTPGSLGQLPLNGKSNRASSSLPPHPSQRGDPNMRAQRAEQNKRKSA